jgi:hypothetical protein
VVNAPTGVLMRSRPCRIRVIEDLRFQLEQAGIDFVKVVKQAIVENKHVKKARYRTYSPKTNMRKCKCGKILPWTANNFFYANKSKGTLSFICKSCQSVVNNKNRKQKRAVRLCNICGNKMDIHNFNIIKIDAVGRVRRKFVCKKCEGGFIHA